MGTLIAIVNKKGENATAEARAMLRATRHPDDCCSILASPSETTPEKADFADHARQPSSSATGLNFPRGVNNPKCQLIRSGKAILAFAGAICDINGKEITADIVGRKVCPHPRGAETFLQSIEGGCAFSSATAGRFTVGRDPLGVEPLYYGENSSFAAIASEKKALWKIGILAPKSFPPGNVASMDDKAITFKPVKTLAYSRTRPMNMQTAARNLLSLLRRSVKCEVSDVDRVAVAFSGGLDSSIIAFLAKETAKEVNLIHVSLRNQPETKDATRTAKELGIPIYIYEYTEDDVEETIPRVLWMAEQYDPVNTGIGIPVCWTAERAAEMGLCTLLTGLGADELFGGYKRYADAYIQHGEPHVREMIINDITHIHETNLERDAKICNACRISLRLPFIAYKIAKLALEMPVELKLQPKAATMRKLVLRQVAKDLELPSSILNRPKRAIQYSTGVSKVLAKLAKKRNLTTAEYLRLIFESTMKEMMPRGD